MLYVSRALLYKRCDIVDTKYIDRSPIQRDIAIFKNWVGHIPIVRYFQFHKAVFQSKLLMDNPGYKVVSMQVVSVSQTRTPRHNVTIDSPGRWHARQMSTVPSFTIYLR